MLSCSPKVPGPLGGDAGKAEEERDLEALDPAPELHGSGAARLLRQTLGASAGPSCSLFDGEE